MNLQIKYATCGVIIGTFLLVGSELTPVLADKIGFHVHPPHYHYEMDRTGVMASVGTTANLVSFVDPGRDGR